MRAITAREVVEGLIKGKYGSPTVALDAVSQAVVTTAIDFAIKENLRVQRLTIAEKVAERQDTGAAALEILRMDF